MNRSNFTNRIVILLITGLLFSGTASFSQTQIAGYTFMGVYDSHYYYISTCGMSWTTANTAAEEVGGYLAAISSYGENQFISDYIYYYIYSRDVWIGLHDPSGTDVFEWSNGEPVIYTPNIVGAGDYVAIWEYPGGGFAYSESELLPSILEFNGINNDCLASDMVNICHNGNVICVHQSAVEAHLNHGDYLGPCSGCNAPANYAQVVVDEVDDAATDHVHMHMDSHDQGWVNDDVEAYDFNIHPNPASDEIVISLPHNSAYVRWITLTGQVFSSEVYNGVQYIRKDISSYPPGMYVVEIQSGEIRSQHKVVIQ